MIIQVQPSTLDVLYGCSLLQRLHVAQRLFADHGERLLSLAAFQKYLKALRLLQDDVRQCMEESGMPAFCQACAQTGITGGCCSHAMTDENDAPLLLLNLLAGVPVELQRGNGTECLFLGIAGCSLRFKPFFCLNYLCGKLRRGIPPPMYQKLANASGRLLQEQYAAEQYLLRVLCGIFAAASGKENC